MLYITICDKSIILLAHHGQCMFFKQGAIFQFHFYFLISESGAGISHNNLKDFRRLDQLTMHPTLPLVKREARGGYRAYLVNWAHPDPEKRFIELFWQDISIFSECKSLKGLKCSDFQFSPDGRWLVFRDVSEMVLR